MLRSEEKATEVKFSPPITSTSIKITVKTVYTHGNNGFREILVYEPKTAKGKEKR